MEKKKKTKEKNRENYTHHTRVPKFLLLFPLTSKNYFQAAAQEYTQQKKENERKKYKEISSRKKRNRRKLVESKKKVGIFPMNYTILLSQNQYSKQAAVFKNVNTYYIGTYTTTANTFKTLIYPF